MASSYNLVAVHGLGAVDDQVTCSGGSCCMSQELYAARQAAYNDALAASKLSRGVVITGMLAAGVGGILLGMVIGRSK